MWGCKLQAFRRYSLALALLLALPPVPPLGAQISVSMDIFPYERFSDPEAGLEEAEIFSSAMRLEVSLPFVLEEDSFAPE